MKLSEISNLKLSPGQYVITASYDGDDEYNGVEAQVLLTINEAGEASYEVRPVDDEDAPPIEKRSPDIEFVPNILNINEKDLTEWPFNWKQYLKNTDNLSYSIQMSSGLVVEDNDHISWSDSGTYTIKIITEESTLFLPKTITLTLNVVAKINPQIDYINKNDEFTLENGDFIKRYRNIEKREGVYMFDLIQPTNPYALPLKYKIDDTKHGTIDTDDNKIYISEEGKYKITAYYEGDDTYRSSITYYILKYYEGEEPAEDEPTQQDKINPNLSFAQSNVTQDKTEDNKYKVLPLINPYSISGGTWVVSRGSITYDGTIITFDGTGSITVSYIFNGDDKYNAQTVSYVLNIKSDDNQDNLPVPDIGFSIPIVTVEENEAHEYQIQYAYNNSGVAINYYYNDELIENGILKTTNTGNLTIVGISENNGTFASIRIYYTLKIVAHKQQDPEISFDTANVNEYQSDNFEYLLQFVNNPHNVELEWSTSNGVIYDNVLYCEELGTVVITVKNKANFYYFESTISYTLVIEETPKLSPELSFDEEAQFFNSNDNNQYSVQSVNNPHNVELRWFSDRGELNSEMNPTTLTISAYSGQVNIYCKSVEDDTYKSETVYYKLYVGAAKKYLQYIKHADYEFAVNSGTFDLEMLRYAKSQDLEFDPTEWRFTSSLPSYCKINEKYYIEVDDYIVVMANLTITKPCNPLISISFLGNDNFYSSSNIRIHVNVTGKNLRSPEITFPNSYVTVEQTTTNKYPLQQVNNPYGVEIIYSASFGDVSGNVLTYEGISNVLITATSVETDVFASKKISYTLNIKEASKPSSGIHFAESEVTITQNNEGIYEIQGLLDSEDNPIDNSNLPGEYRSSVLQDPEYDDENDRYILVKPNWYGTIYITFNIRETGQYKAETITYTLNILSNVKPSPNLAFEKYQINVTQNSNGIYPLQALINPNNVPVTWFCSKGEFDDQNNPQNIIFSGREYIRISVRSEETQDFKSEEQAYGMTIMLPSKKDAGLSFDKYSMATQRNDEGIYPLQRANNPNNVSPLTYSVSKGRIEGDNIIYDDIGTITVTVSYPGDDIYEAVNLRYTLDIGGKFKKYLDVEECQDVEMTGELNEDIEVQLVRWNTNKEYTFNPADWTITSSHFRCTYKSMRTEEINGYVYLIGRFSFKAEGTAYITTSFKGNDDFNNDEGHGLWIEYTVPTVVDNRVLPSISFNNYMVYVTQNDNYMYLLQSLNKPDDVEIDHWEINYGGDDSETAKIIDDEYVYYEGTDYVNVKVFTKESDVYKPTSDSYTLYVNEQTKIGTSIYFIWDKINTNRTTEGIYNVQSANISPANLPVVWATSKGTLTDNNTKLNYSDTGEVTITCSFEGNDEYEAATASYKLIISNEYVKKNLEAEKYSDQHLDNIEYNTEYDVPLIKWSLSDNLEYDPAEWSFTGDNSTKWNLVYLFTSDDEEYRTLYAKMTFNQNGNTYYTLNFANNPYYYGTKWQSEIYFNKPEQGKISPQISWPDPTPDPVERRNDGKYLIQTPISEYQDVEFNEPYSSKAIIEENGQYYISYSGVGDVNIYVSNKASNTYYQHTISYTLKIVAPQTLPDAPIRFAVSTIDRKHYVDNTYQPQTLDNPQNLAIRWESSLGTIDSTTGVLTYDGTGAVIIKAIFDGDNTYNYTEATYTLNILESVQKKYLEVSKYGDQNIEVILDDDVDIPLIKWNPETQNLDYVASEWTISNTYVTKAVYKGMHTVDEEGYRTLYATFNFTTSGTTQIALKFKGNDYYYEVNSPWRINVEFYRSPDIVLIDPKISWPEEEQSFVEADDNKYLIQTPVSEYNDVEFNNPTVSRGVLVEENSSFYVQADGLDDIVVSIKNISNNKYIVTTISYTIKLTEKQIIKEDSELSFANSVDNVEYVWQSGAPKYYKIQPLHNPYDIPVAFQVNKKLIVGTSKTYLEGGYIDYNNYIEVDGIEDVIITVIGQENDYYYITSSPSYTMHIQRSGQVVDMYFTQNLVNYTINSNSHHKLQEVTLNEEIADIRNNIVYNVDGNNATITKQNGVYYLVTNTPGNYTIRATYQGNGTYASTETSYVLNIDESTKDEAPIYFSEDNIYTLEQESNIYPLQMPLCSDNSFNFDNILIWNLPSGWSLVGTNGITTSQPITENTTLHIECSIPETEYYYAKTIHYDLTIQSKVYLNVTVHDNYVNELKQYGVLEQEILRWPVSQNVQYVASEWTFTYQTSPQNDAFAASFTHKISNGYHIISIYYLATFFGTITVSADYAGNSRVHPGHYGLYIRLKEYIKPESEKDDPEICWSDGDFIEVNSEQNQQYNKPNITNPHNVSYDLYYQQAVPKVSGDTITNYTQLNLIGSRQSFSSSISFQGEGYVVCTLVSRSNDNYYSVTDYIVLYIRKDPNAPVVPTQSPNFYVSKTYINTNYNEEHKYLFPTITNTDNVEYHIYKDNSSTEVLLDNGYVNIDHWGPYVYIIKTVATETFVSKSITVRYEIEDPTPTFNGYAYINQNPNVEDSYYLRGYNYSPTLGYNIVETTSSDMSSNFYILDEINTPNGNGFANMQFYIKWKTSDYNITNNFRYKITRTYNDSRYLDIYVGPTITTLWDEKYDADLHIQFFAQTADRSGNYIQSEPLSCDKVYLYQEGEYTYLLPRIYIGDRDKFESDKSNYQWRKDKDFYNVTIDYQVPGYKQRTLKFWYVEFQRFTSNWQVWGAPSKPMLYSNKLVSNLNELKGVEWKESNEVVYFT